MGGPDGYYRLVAGVRSRNPGGASLSLGVVRMRNNGFRKQEYVARDQAFLVNRFPLKAGHASLYLTFQKARWGLPGSLDSLTAARSPRMARPYSQQIDARVEKSQVFAGIAVEQRGWKDVELRSSLHVQHIGKVNPYGTSPGYSGYKDETVTSAGTRLSLGRTHQGSKISFSWAIGLEALLERDELRERAFADAMPAALRTDASTRVGHLNGFLTTHLRIADRTGVQAELGTEATSFRHDDHLRNMETKDMPRKELYPMIGVQHRFSEGLKAYVRYAESTSRPTIWEVLGTVGIPNPTLVAEHVREAGTGIGFHAAHASATLHGYLRRTAGLILPKPAAVGEGEVFYNAGDARQNGLELAAHWQPDLGGEHPFELLLNGAWQHHRLALPGMASTVDVPGVPRWTGGLRWRWGMGNNTGIELGYRAISTVAATTFNRDRLAGHGLLHLHLAKGWRWPGCSMEAGVLVNNMLNVRYTTFIQLNDPYGRYYNPAPGRSLFARFTFTFGTPDNEG